MEKLIRQSWWKALGVVLLVYVHTVGMLAPLKPGIVSTTPDSARTGEKVTVAVQGYNTHFDSAEDSLRAWLKLDDKRALAAGDVAIKSETELEVVFSLPAYLPTDKRVQDFSLVLDNAIDGAFVRPSALLVTQDSIDPAMGQSAWTNANIADLHQHGGITFPFRSILGETIRNTYFHVSLWLAMVIIFTAALVYSIRYLRGQQPRADEWASALTTVGVLYGLLGLITGAIWARYTWGQFWSWDIKQFTTLVALLIYLAYFVLRSAFPDQERKGRISAVYNIFAFVALIPLIYVLPRLTDSLHPGNGGNPALGGEDLDNTMRMVFYPAVLGWTLIGAWMASLYYRMLRVERLSIEN
jgi:heme exporter protein C